MPEVWAYKSVVQSTTYSTIVQVISAPCTTKSILQCQPHVLRLMCIMCTGGAAFGRAVGAQLCAGSDRLGCPRH